MLFIKTSSRAAHNDIYIYIYYCCSMVKIFGEGYYDVSDRKCDKKRSVMLGMFRGLIMATSPWITGWDEWMRLLRP